LVTNNQEDFDETLKIATSINDSSLRNYVVYDVARKLVTKKSFEKVDEIIKKDTDATRKISLYVYLAKEQIKDKNFTIAEQNIFEAESLLKSIDNNEKTVAQFAIASLYTSFNEQKAIQIWSEGIDTEGVKYFV
jgi:hypothetical protein